MAYLSSNSTATMLDGQQQQPYKSNSWGEYECKENVHQRGVTMMGAPSTNNTGDDNDETAPMIPPAAEDRIRRVSQEEFLEPAPTATTTTTSSSSCLGKHTFDQDAAYSVHASKSPRTNDGGNVPSSSSSAITAATSTSSSATTKSSAMTTEDFSYDAHDPSILPVAPSLLRYSSSIGSMGLALPPLFLNSTSSFGSLLGGHEFLPPPPLLSAQSSSSFSFAGSEARFAIAGKNSSSSSFSQATGGLLGVNDVSEEDTAAAVSALLELTPAVTSRQNHHHHHHVDHGRTPLAELNHVTSSISHDHQKPCSNSSSTFTTTTTGNMASLPKPAAAHDGSTPSNHHHQQQQDNNSTLLVASIHGSPPPTNHHHQQTDDNSTLLVASIQNAARTATRLLVNVPISDKACKCKKNTHCLKLYCACFQNGTLCDPKICNCKDCKNTEAFNGPHGDRSKAVDVILHRRFDAFDKTRPKKKTGVGCACKKTKCLKKYCDCYNNKVACGDACTCTDCANTGSTTTLAEMMTTTVQECKNSTSPASSTTTSSVPPAASSQPV